MKVLHVIPVYEPAWSYGGPVQSVSIMCKGLAKLGIDITVYTTNANKSTPLAVNISEPILIDGVKVYRFPTLSNSNYFLSPLLTRRIIHDVKAFDLIHITSIWNYPGLPAAFSAKISNIPFLYSARGSLIPETYKGSKYKSYKKIFYYYIFLKYNFNAARAIHFSNIQEYKLSKKFIPDNIPCVIIPNGIDTSEFETLPPRSIAKKSFPMLPEKSIVISYLGRLHARKKLDKVIEALYILLKKRIDVCLVLAGPDDGVKSTLVNLTNELDLNSRVFFPGLLDSNQRRDLFAITDIFSFIGSENFGMSLAEAMACGIPVIVSHDVCIYNDIGKNGAGLVSNDDSQQIANNIHILINNPEQRMKMGKNARVLVNSKYTRTKTDYSMKCAYEDIVNGNFSKTCEWVIANK